MLQVMQPQHSDLRTVCHDKVNVCFRSVYRNERLRKGGVKVSRRPVFVFFLEGGVRVWFLQATGIDGCHICMAGMNTCQAARLHASAPA